MYEVEMKYADLFNVDTLNFTCENFNINDKGYKFENVHHINTICTGKFTLVYND